MPHPEPEIIGPSSSFYVSQRLKLHYVDWGNETKPALILVHGGRDHARSWDWVARDLRRDHHVVAPDLRGHGDSAWAIGGLYAISDFVLDVANLVDALELDRFTLVGHSLGGAIALQYAGVYPGRVRRLVAIEGLGPTPDWIERARARPPWERMQKWIAQMRELSARQPRRYPSLEAAAARMREANAFLSEAQSRHLTVHGVARNEDGTYGWKFDNYVRSFAPYRFDVDDMRALWQRIECPTLLVRGSESWSSDPAQDGRLRSFGRVRAETIADAGHWVHHDRLEAFLAIVRGFLAEDSAASVQPV